MNAEQKAVMRFLDLLREKGDGKDIPDLMAAVYLSIKSVPLRKIQIVDCACEARAIAHPDLEPLGPKERLIHYLRTPDDILISSIAGYIVRAYLAENGRAEEYDAAIKETHKNMTEAGKVGMYL